MSCKRWCSKPFSHGTWAGLQCVIKIWVGLQCVIKIWVGLQHAKNSIFQAGLSLIWLQTHETDSLVITIMTTQMWLFLMYVTAPQTC